MQPSSTLAVIYKQDCASKRTCVVITLGSKYGKELQYNKCPIKLGVPMFYGWYSILFWTCICEKQQP